MCLIEVSNFANLAIRRPETRHQSVVYWAPKAARSYKISQVAEDQPSYLCPFTGKSVMRNAVWQVEYYSDKSGIPITNEDRKKAKS
jgi:hypothetical protein